MNKIAPSASTIQDGRHRLPIRVYYEDTDSGGVVYYANYLRFAERARTEMLREIGSEHRVMKEELGIGFVVRQCNADYQKPAFLDDQLVVETEILAVRGASIQMRQTVTKDNEALVVMDVKLACMSFDGSAARIPKPVRMAMTELSISKSEDK
ncbi:MAG: tol-pal system-associated acyl-CoA thioesterase [Rhodospirillaceae bacterium]|jgi:acyl-CoA thioester hydrolase|nr:tol-pal system-associated acyl-CoA thioesterase [Rhodospirillaceae bacterium]MBT5941641.1 tol-pal system-associated acyl-CoA thioesterase [Rhodospirillaceae bacterium]MBT7266211.1 tol-pal system-associated acyl-CoA thioesterase [Rhodospirillaceae bacterium]